MYITCVYIYKHRELQGSRDRRAKKWACRRMYKENNFRFSLKKPFLRSFWLNKYTIMCLCVCFYFSKGTRKEASACKEFSRGKLCVCGGGRDTRPQRQTRMSESGHDGTHTISALEKLRQQAIYKFKASLDHKVRPCLKDTIVQTEL